MHKNIQKSCFFVSACVLFNRQKTCCHRVMEKTKNACRTPGLYAFTCVAFVCVFHTYGSHNRVKPYQVKRKIEKRPQGKPLPLRLSPPPTPPTSPPLPLYIIIITSAPRFLPVQITVMVKYIKRFYFSTLLTRPLINVETELWLFRKYKTFIIPKTFPRCPVERRTVVEKQTNHGWGENAHDGWYKVQKML